MAGFSLMTERLRLVAGTLELARAAVAGADALAKALNADVPPSWPPELHDADTAAFFAQCMRRRPKDVGWMCWYVVLRAESSGRDTVIGTAGFKGRPNAEGAVEIGASLLPEYHGKGYAAEAMRALLAWAFAHREVRRVVAETFPVNSRSIRLLEKCGFAPGGAGSEPEVVRYDLTRERFGGRECNLGDFCAN